MKVNVIPVTNSLLLLPLIFLQDVVPEWQTAASNLLSTLGLKYAKEVMQELLTKFQTGQLPHFFIVSTLGQLATSNGKFIKYMYVNVHLQYTA